MGVSRTLNNQNCSVSQGDQGLQGPPGPFEYVDPPEDLYIKGEQVISTEVQLRFYCGTFTASVLSILQFCVVLVLQGAPGVKGICGLQGLSVSSTPVCQED